MAPIPSTEIHVELVVAETGSQWFTSVMVKYSWFSISNWLKGSCSTPAVNCNAMSQAGAESSQNRVHRPSIKNGCVHSCILTMPMLLQPAMMKHPSTQNERGSANQVEVTAVRRIVQKSSPSAGVNVSRSNWSRGLSCISSSFTGGLKYVIE